MTQDEVILTKVTNAFLSSAETESFNGLRASALLEFEHDRDAIREHLQELTANRKIDCVFSKYSVNMHIKRLPDLPLDVQLTGITEENLDSFCIYPTAEVVEESCDTSKWDNRPFSKELLLGRPQLEFRSFDMAALERYASDPRYQVHFNDYMGRMSIGDDAFREMGFPERDKVSLQTFGLGFNEGKIPHAIVFLRYLSYLSPEHQHYWKSYLAEGEVKMTRPYYEASFDGNFWKNRSVRYAIMQEIDLINRMLETIYGRKLFRKFDEEDVPIGVTAFLRPTSANFEAFVMALDKLLSERIDHLFFKGQLELEEEIPRGEGKVELKRKASIRLLEEWLLGSLNWEDEQAVRDTIVGPFREVRKLRQKPAHEFGKNEFSLAFHKERRRLLGSVLNSLQSMRAAFSTHPAAKDISVPKWLDEEPLDNL